MPLYVLESPLLTQEGLSFERGAKRNSQHFIIKLSVRERF